MNPLAFFRSQAVRSELKRASVCASMPVSLHYVRDGEEGPAVFSAGGCTACKRMAESPEGRVACRASRSECSQRAVSRGKPVSFVCHMGFACVSVSALDAAPGFVLTFGPFNPSEAPESLEIDARDRWRELFDDEDGLELDDVIPVSGNAAPALAQWTKEGVERLWFEQTRSQEDGAPPVETNSQTLTRNKRKGRAFTDPYDSAQIAAALAGGNRKQVRALIDGVLCESESRVRVSPAVRRARTAALIASVLEASARAGLSTEGVWAEYPTAINGLFEAESDRELRKIATDLLWTVAKSKPKAQKDDDGLEKLNELLEGRLVDGVTLNEAAAALGQHPTAITHRLQRKYDMSFSQYMGRLRVDKAKEALRRTKLGVGEVARRVGIDDTSNFAKLFRKFEGMSPLEYRRRRQRK